MGWFVLRASPAAAPLQLSFRPAGGAIIGRQKGIIFESKLTHCAVIRRFVSISRRGLPLQRPDIPHHKHQNPSEGVEDAIDREFNDLFDQWRKLTNEILSEPTERYEIGESVLLGKAIPYPAQVNSVKGV